MIYLGADHGGFELKENIKKFLDKNKYKYIDLGNSVIDNEDDYPVYAFAVAQRVGKEDSPKSRWSERAKGILFCRSSGGMIIAANKVKGVYAVSVFDETSAKHSREHNDANVIALSGDWTDENKAEKIVKVWLETEFSKEDRHKRRIGIIKKHETNQKDIQGG